jgi:hypothetical protein
MGTPAVRAIFSTSSMRQLAEWPKIFCVHENLPDSMFGYHQCSFHSAAGPPIMVPSKRPRQSRDFRVICQRDSDSLSEKSVAYMCLIKYGVGLSESSLATVVLDWRFPNPISSLTSSVLSET